MNLTEQDKLEVRRYSAFLRIINDASIASDFGANWVNVTRETFDYKIRGLNVDPTPVDDAHPAYAVLQRPRPR